MTKQTNDMPEDDEAPIDETPEEAREWFEKKIATSGIRIAYETLVGVCNNPKAPAPAKATAGVALMRAAGVFARASEELNKQPHEMTAEELQRDIASLREMKRLLSQSSDGDVPGVGVFG